MNKKAKISGHAGRIFYKFLGKSHTKSFLSFYFRKKFKKHKFNFPVPVASVKKILIILPEDSIEILHQLKNLLSLISIFKNADFTLFCPDDSASIVKLLPKITIVEYHKSEVYDFASQLSNFADQFKNSFDICILLDRNPQLSILSLVGSTNAPIRAGYQDAGDYPFLNLRAREQTLDRYLTEKNCSISELFGKQTDTLKMNVSKKTLEEIDNHLKEMEISSDHGLFCLDIDFFIRKFGREWLERFIQMFQLHSKCTVFGYLYEDPTKQESELLEKLKIPFIMEKSISKIAALVFRSDLVITGNTLLYGLAAVLNKSSIGFFKKEEFTSYCPDSAKQKGIIFDKVPDNDIIKNVVQLSGKMI